MTVADEFKGAVERVKKARADRQAAQQAQLNAVSSAREQLIARASSKLHEIVRPLLDQAAEALRAEGISLTISEEFDVRNRHESVLPALVAQCVGAKKGDWAPLSHKLYIATDGSRLEIATGPSMTKNPDGQKKTITIEKDFKDAILAAFEKCVESYYGEVDRYRS